MWASSGPNGSPQNYGRQCGSEVGWSAAGLSLTSCTNVTASKPTTEALSRHRRGGAVTRELITENAIRTLCSLSAFVCLAFGCCLLLARRVNIQSLAVMSAFNKGRSLLVCTGRPSGLAKRGAGGRGAGHISYVRCPVCHSKTGPNA